MAAKMSQKVTLKTISEKLGVTQATVSKALRESTDISEEMKKKVRAISEELGYYPNLLARSLVQRRSHIIGVIIPDINISYYADLVQHIYESAQTIGYESIVMFHHENPEKERKNLQFLVSLQVDGILICETNGRTNSDLINLLQEQGTPVVYYDRINPDAKIGFITIDDAKATDALLRAFIERDRTKIGYIGAIQGKDVTVARFLNYKDLLANYGLKYNPHRVVECLPDGTDAFENMNTALSMDIDIDALICAGGLIAYHAGQAILSAGISMPKKILLAEFGNNNIVQRLGASYLKIDQSPDLIAKKSVDILESFLANNEDTWTPNNVFVESKLIYYDHLSYKEEVIEVVT
jgi:DNA-binding LacI/PurR family transcriptional regulator